MTDEQKAFCRNHFFNYTGSLAFNSQMFEKEWDYVIMSFHDDMIFKNYINKREGFSVTLSPSRKFGDTSVIGIEDTTYEGGKKWLDENFYPGEYISEERFYENIKWIINRLPEKTKLIFVNGPTLDFFRKNNPHCPEVREQIKRINKVLDKIVTENKGKCALVDINKVIKSTNDVTDYVFHLKAQTAYNLFVEIVWAIVRNFKNIKSSMLASVRTDRKVVIYGNSSEARNAFYNLKLGGESPIAYFHFNYSNKKIGTMEVKNSIELKDKASQYYVVIADENNISNIETELEAYGYKPQTDFTRLQKVEYKKMWNENISGGGQSKNKQCVDTVAVCRDDNVSRIPSAESNKRKTLICVTNNSDSVYSVISLSKDFDVRKKSIEQFSNLRVEELMETDYYIFSGEIPDFIIEKLARNNLDKRIRYINGIYDSNVYDMPWKYSPEKIIADKIVVACDVDYRIFRKNGFAKTDLWKVGLPRFDELHKANKSDKQRILYAPSWRSYLVGENVNGDWKALDKKFLSSRYYMETKAFLESDVLYKMLEKQEYTLDVKVHPIFQKYADNFIGSNDRIHLKSSINEEDYSLMITDFSSYMFDFLYLGTAIFSFIPDYQEFKCGMNGYRNVDFMTKIDEEEIAKTSDEIINKIEKFFMTRKGMLCRNDD